MALIVSKVLLLALSVKKAHSLHTDSQRDSMIFGLIAAGLGDSITRVLSNGNLQLEILALEKAMNEMNTW
jgi:hypothetical protein